MTKKLISNYIRNLDDVFFAGEIEVVIARITELKNKYSDYSQLYIEVEHSYESIDFNLLGKRLETDLEYRIRIKHEEKLKSAAENFKKNEIARQRRLYLRLKKKFGE